ncbi:MAG: filamentous hemagglutinin N-terminal domain-containing protein [Thermodesulfobacteriota bacterium]
MPCAQPPRRPAPGDLRRPRLPLALAAVLLLSAAPRPGGAGITTDGSLGQARTLTGPGYTIGPELGQQTGGNLFHSFGQFSLLASEQATFTGPASVTSIISRVTGGSPSAIDGLLRSAIPGADLYFINPAGVVVGPHASLEVSGSFHVSTADYLQLGEAGRFSASDPGASTLAAAPPAAFGFLTATPAAIRVEGAGSRAGSEIIPRELGRSGHGLLVPAGETLAVVGGDITLTTGQLLADPSQVVEARLRAPAGRIDLVSVASPGEVKPTASGVEITGGTDLGSIALGGLSALADPASGSTLAEDRAVRLDTSGPAGGTIRIRGGQLVMAGASCLASDSHDTGGGSIDVRIAGQIRLEDQARIQAEHGGSGQGSSLAVSAETISLAAGSEISTLATGAGSGGPVSVEARGTLIVTGDSAAGLASAIGTETAGSGAAGAVTVRAADLVLADGGLVAASSLGSGDGGAVDVVAGRLLLSEGGFIVANAWSSGDAGSVTVTASEGAIMAGEDAGGRPSGIQAATAGSGDGGAISLSTPELALVDGATILANARGGGDAGSIDLQVDTLRLAAGGNIQSSTTGAGAGGQIAVQAAESVVITGRLAEDLPSGIWAETLGPGRGGTVTIDTPDLLMTDSALLSTGTFFGNGQGGAMHLVVDRLRLTDGARVAANSHGWGDGGGISVVANESALIAGAAVEAKARGRGDGGSVFIQTPALRLTEEGWLTSAAGAFSQGDAGDILLAVDRLTLDDGGRIEADALGSGNGGQIRISAAGAVVLDGRRPDGPWSTISAGVFGGGTGGGIDIEAPEVVVLGPRSQISTSGWGETSGAAGGIRLAVGDLTVVDGGNIWADTWGTGGGGRIDIAASRSVLVAGDEEGQGGGRITAEVFGAGDGGAIVVRAPTLAVAGDGRISTSTSEDSTGAGGDILLQVGELQLVAGGAITADTQGHGASGGIAVAADRSVAIGGRSRHGLGSMISADVFADGDGRGIVVDTPELLLASGGRIATDALRGSFGHGGDILVRAADLRILHDGAISASTAGRGQGGGITIAGGQSVHVAGWGSSIATTSLWRASGDAGDVVIRDVDRLELADSGRIATDTWGAGEAGDIVVSVDDLALVDGGTITADTLGAGRGGDIAVSAARSARVAGPDRRQLGSLISSEVFAQGAGGSIVVETPELVLAGEGRISTSSLFGSSGKPGDIGITVDRLELVDGGGIWADTSGVAAGGGVSVTATSSVLLAGRGPDGVPSMISSESFGAGTGGDVAVAAPHLALARGGAISASTGGTGDAGTIRILAERLELASGATIRASSTGSGQARDIAVDAADRILLTGSTIATETRTADGGNIRLAAQQEIQLIDSAVTTSVAGGAGNGGNIVIDPRFVILENSRIIANAYGGDGGNIRIVAGAFLADASSRVEASSQLGIDGTVAILAPDANLLGGLTVLPDAFLEGSPLFADPCATRRRQETSSLTLAGRQGMPPEPSQPLAGSRSDRP